MNFKIVQQPGDRLGVVRVEDTMACGMAIVAAALVNVVGVGKLGEVILNLVREDACRIEEDSRMTLDLGAVKSDTL